MVTVTTVILTSFSLTGRYSIEPSNATTSPVVGRWSFIMPKRIATDSTLGLGKKFTSQNTH